MWRQINKLSGSKTSSAMTWFLFSTFSFAFGILAVVLLNNGWSAEISLKEQWRRCDSKFSEVFLAGHFAQPGTAQPMTLWVGKSKSGEPVSASITREGSEICEARCEVIGFERYLKDRAPALLSLECSGVQLAQMKMPLHVVWDRDNRVVIRLGSSIYGVDEAKLQVAVNRYGSHVKLAKTLD